MWCRDFFVELWDSVVFFFLSEFGVPTVPGWLDLAGWLAERREPLMSD